MIGPGTDPIRRRPSIFTAPIVGPSAPLRIWRTSEVSFRSTVTPDSSAFASAAISCWRRAGPMRGASSMRCIRATGSPVAAEALSRIAGLYAIEATIRGQTAEARQGVRRTKSLPLVGAMKTWLEAQLHRLPPRGGLADAIRYALTRWDALCRFLD